MRDQDKDGVVVGWPIQGIHESSTTQNYPIGMIHERHGRRFRYCMAYEELAYGGRGHPNMAYMPWIAGNLFACGDGDLKVAAIAGDQKIIVKVDDCTVINTQTVDYFVGGLAVIFPASNCSQNYRISGNDASYVDPGSADYENVPIYLDEPLPIGVDADVQVDLYPSPYRNVGHSSSGDTYMSYVCVPNCAEVIASGSFFWGQTRGPAWVTPYIAITGALQRDVVFHYDGTVRVAAGNAMQRAGYIIQRGDGSCDDSLIQLMLE